MTNEENEQAQLMRDKARENVAFFQPEPPSKFAEWEAEKHIEWRAKCLNLKAAMKTMAEGHKLAMEVERKKVEQLHHELSCRCTESDQLDTKCERLEAKVRELEAQLAQAQDKLAHTEAANSEMARSGAALEEQGRQAADEFKALQAQCASMREALRASNLYTTSAGQKCESCRGMWDDHHPDCVVGKALSTNAGQELLSRLGRYEKAFEKLHGFGKGDLTAGELCDYLNETIDEALKGGEK